MPIVVSQHVCTQQNRYMIVICNNLHMVFMLFSPWNLFLCRELVTFDSIALGKIPAFLIGSLKISQVCHSLIFYPAWYSQRTVSQWLLLSPTYFKKSYIICQEEKGFFICSPETCGMRSLRSTRCLVLKGGKYAPSPSVWYWIVGNNAVFILNFNFAEINYIVMN